MSARIAFVLAVTAALLAPDPVLSPAATSAAAWVAVLVAIRVGLDQQETAA